MTLSSIRSLFAIAFAGAGDIPVTILFFKLTPIYLTQFLIGLWLIYLTYGVVLNLALGYHWWV